jgi:hypothetical protein
MACRIRYYEYQVDVDFLAPWQQIPENISHKSPYPKKDYKGLLLGDPFGGI